MISTEAPKNDVDIIRELRAILQDLSERFNFRYDNYLPIVISNRLRSSNGRITWRRNYYTGEVEDCKIVMSRALLEEFGWDRFEKTFRHEVAHLANLILYGGKGHGESFKRLCRDFGGAMNTRMAGYRYSECATTDFVKPITKWIYTCPCGKVKKMAKRMSKKKRGSSHYICGKCRTYTLDTWTEQRV